MLNESATVSNQKIMVSIFMGSALVVIAGIFTWHMWILKEERKIDKRMKLMAENCGEEFLNSDAALDLTSKQVAYVKSFIEK